MDWKINPKLKVAVVGFASSSRNQAPFGDESWEIWGLNSLYALIPRWNRWFEIHPKDYLRQDLQRAELLAAGIDHYTWLTQVPGPDGRCSKADCGCKNGKAHAPFCPIYMQQHYPEIPASVRWPREEINAWTVERFGANAETDYFTSTPGQMVATAIYEGAGEIAVYGVDLLQEEEYAYQRPGCEYWLGIARGLGIKVYVPPACALVKASYVYGYTEPPTTAKAAKPLVDFFQYQNTSLEVEQQKTASLVNKMGGALEAFRLVVKKVEEGATTEQIKEALGPEIKRLEENFTSGMDSLKKMGAQREAFASCAAWTGEWARGGRLGAMAKSDLTAGSSEKLTVASMGLQAEP